MAEFHGWRAGPEDPALYLSPHPGGLDVDLRLMDTEGDSVVVTRLDVGAAVVLQEWLDAAFAATAQANAALAGRLTP